MPRAQRGGRSAAGRGFGTRRGTARESNSSSSDSSESSFHSSRASLPSAAASPASTSSAISISSGSASPAPNDLSSDSDSSVPDVESRTANALANLDTSSDSSDSSAALSISSGSLSNDNLDAIDAVDETSDSDLDGEDNIAPIAGTVQPSTVDFPVLSNFPFNLGGGSSAAGSSRSRSLDDILLGFASDSSDDDDVLRRFRGLINFSPPGASLRPTTGDDVSSVSDISLTSFAEGAFGGFGSRSFLEETDSAGNSPPQTSSSASSTENRPVSAGTSTATMSAAATSGGSISFECNVCLESLDGPASIDVDVPGAQPTHSVADTLNLVNSFLGRTGGNHPRNTARMSTGGPCQGATAAATARGRGRRRTANSNENVSLTDVVATQCGHLYHQVCLLKWFTQQGRRTCPSCRKSVPSSKLIRLYPSSTASTGDGGVRNLAQGQGMPLNDNGNGPSTSSTAASTANSNGTCGSANCQDLKDIHNTLINDYTELQERYNNLRDNEGVKEAQISSLEEDNTRKEEEIVKLKRELEEIRGATASTSTGAKRRRR